MQRSASGSAPAATPAGSAFGTPPLRAAPQALSPAAVTRQWHASAPRCAGPPCVAEVPGAHVTGWATARPTRAVARVADAVRGAVLGSTRPCSSMLSLHVWARPGLSSARSWQRSRAPTGAQVWRTATRRLASQPASQPAPPLLRCVRRTSGARSARPAAQQVTSLPLLPPGARLARAAPWHAELRISAVSCVPPLSGLPAVVRGAGLHRCAFRDLRCGLRMGGPPPLPPRPAELIRDDRRALLQFVLEVRPHAAVRRADICDTGCSVPRRCGASRAFRTPCSTTSPSVHFLPLCERAPRSCWRQAGWCLLHLCARQR